MSAVEQQRFSDATEKERLWEWTLHEDNLFSDRQNLFLVAESMLVAGHAAALDASAESAATAIALIALVLTLAWGFVSWRMATLVEYIQTHARRELREYGLICDERPKVAGSKLIRSRVVVAYLVPLLLATLWVLLLVLLV
jgi:hypothetical protein